VTEEEEEEQQRALSAGAKPGLITAPGLYGSANEDAGSTLRALGPETEARRP
jgi:hypothetical protein